jgi:hypothetical protein
MKSRKLLVLLGIASLPILTIFVIQEVQSRAVARYQRQLLAAGERLDIADIIPPPPLPEKNGAPIFLEAMAGRSWSFTNLLDKNSPASMRMIGPGKAIVGWAQPDVRDDQTNSWAEIESALGDWSETLDAVREAAERPVFDFHLDYRQGFGLLLPHLAPLKHTQQLLAATALCSLHRGDAATATTNVEAMLNLMRSTGYERFAISQLVRMAMAQIAVPATWELLQSPQVTDAELAAIQRGWTDLDFIQPTEDAAALERAMGQMMLERMRQSGAQFRQIAGGGMAGSSYSSGPSGEAFLRGIVLGAKEAEWRLFFSNPDQLRALKGHQVVLESLRMVKAGKPFTVAISRQTSRLAELGLDPSTDNSGAGFNSSDPDLRSFFSETVKWTSRGLTRVFDVEIARDVALTAVALKRYQLRHGQYPAALSALVPELLPAVPRDPADGQPLRYRLEPDGTYLLYSVGEDGIDNGGDATREVESKTPRWEKGRDCVWPWPASAEEVAAWRQKGGKKGGR